MNLERDPEELVELEFLEREVFLLVDLLLAKIVWSVCRHTSGF